MGANAETDFNCGIAESRRWKLDGLNENQGQGVVFWRWFGWRRLVEEGELRELGSFGFDEDGTFKGG
jgi:hypothetical protein